YRVRTVCERQLEPGEPREDQPRPALRILRPAIEERSEVRLEFLLGRPEPRSEYGGAGAGRSVGGDRRNVAVEREPNRHVVEVRLEQLGTAHRLCVGPQR